jgi:membrane-associated protease RseP (regulator of RpoE activity)
MKIGLRVWILIIVLFLAALAIIPLNIFEKGVLVKSVELNSTAFESGLRQNQIITSIDGETISNFEDYSAIMSQKNYSNESIKTVVSTDNGEFILFSNKQPEITVSDIPKTNIKTGLDLAGGSRALIKAKDRELSSSEVNDLADIISNRLNVYGISDVQISPVSDSPIRGNNFLSIEIAGATPTDLKDLISSQGKFEAKIGNQTVFIGGEKDIASVSRGGQDALIESCDSINNGYACRFRFSITLSPEAAQRHADITKNISINATNPEYLSKTLDLYVDDKLQTSLQYLVLKSVILRTKRKKLQKVK